MHWSASGSGGGYGAGDYGIVPSPLSGTVAYSINQGGQTSSNVAEITADGGAQWNVWNLDPSVFPDGDSVSSVLASALDPHSYYANAMPVSDSLGHLPGYTIRVSRGSATFARPPFPTGKRFIGFPLEQDLPGNSGAGGQGHGAARPGQSPLSVPGWREDLAGGGVPGRSAGHLPAALVGQCVRRGQFVVNLIGVFPFTGAHSVGPRLPISGTLPLKIQDHGTLLEQFHPRFAYLMRDFEEPNPTHAV